MTQSRCALIVCVGLALPACVGGVGDEVDEDPRLPSGAPGPARISGWVGMDVVPYEPGAIALAPEDAAPRPLEARSREELAEALRPVLLRGDGMFVMREPNWAAADAVRAAGAGLEAAGAAGAPLDDAAGVARRRAGDDVSVSLEDIRASARILGADGRVRVTNTTVAPYRAMARMIVTYDDGSMWQCTGTYVGPWTLILAGHCLRQPNGMVARRILFEPANNGGSLPYGSYTCRNDDAATTNDFLAAFPAGFGSTADPAYDYAVIDTWPCRVAPHWMGEPATNQGVLMGSGDTTYSVHGYPVGRCPGASLPGVYNCGMSGSAYVNGPWIETEHIDTDIGQSGGPWHIGGRVAATHIGYREYIDLPRCGLDVCRRNFARRIDSAYMWFINQISYDYP